jgi:hypothetical protein
MARVVYIQKKNQCNDQDIDPSNFVTNEKLKEGIQEAKDYTDSEINKINIDGGSSHIHNNLEVLSKLKEVNGNLCFDEINLNGVIFETVEG